MLLERLKEIKKTNKLEKPETPKFNKTILFFLGCFSVAFGCFNFLVIEELNIFTSVTILFGVIFYIVNESYKGKNIIEFAKTKSTSSLVISIITLLISLTSVYGIYQTLNTYSISPLQNVSYKIEIDSINRILDSRYADSVIKLQNEELYSKKLSDSVKQVISIKKREFKERIQLSIKDLKEKEKLENKKLLDEYENKSNSKIIVILFLIFMVVIIEVSIVGICYSYGGALDKYDKDVMRFKEEEKSFFNSKEMKKFQDYLRGLNYIYASNVEEGDKFYKTKFKHLGNDSEEFTTLLNDLKIINTSNSTITMSKENAIITLEKYFESLINDEI